MAILFILFGILGMFLIHAGLMMMVGSTTPMEWLVGLVMFCWGWGMLAFATKKRGWII